jgi:hypothetical protein
MVEVVAGLVARREKAKTTKADWAAKRVANEAKARAEASKARKAAKADQETAVEAEGVKESAIDLLLAEAKAEAEAAEREAESEAGTLFDLFLLLDRKQQKEFYALVIGAFMPTTPPAPEPQPRGTPERRPEELLNVQRKLLETELVVALDGATKENPAWGLTRDGWTAVQMLLGVAAAPDSELPPFEADPIPEPELDRSAPWTFPLPAPGKLDVAALVKPLLGARAAA